MVEPLQDWVKERIRATQAAHGLTTDTVDLSALRYRAREGRSSGVCRNCGQLFVPHNSAQKYCARACLDAAWKAPKRPPRNCERCGEQYTPLSATQRYCSGDCRREVEKQLHKERRSKAVATRKAAEAIRAQAVISLGSVKAIQQIVAGVWDVPIWEMWSPSRKHEAALARHAAISLVRHLLGMSEPKIGEAFGHRDPSTISNALVRCEQLRDSNPKYAGRYARAEAKCRLALESA